MKTTVLEDKLFKSFTETLANIWKDDLIAEAGKSLRKSNPCWKGYHPVGTKKKGGKTVPNCVPNEGVAEATPRHFGPKGAGTELARQIRANGELDRNKQPKPTGIPKKNEFNITEPKAKIQVKKDKGVAEAISQKDLISRLQKDLPRIDDPKNKDAEPVKWTGPKKGDYGHTGYQGHGMPTDKAERDRIRADKKKAQGK